MKVIIDLFTQNKVVFDPPALCIIEIRDVTLLDVKAPTVSSKEIQIVTLAPDIPVSVDLEIPGDPVAKRSLSLWVHLSVSNSRNIKVGDYITTSSVSLSQNLPGDHIRAELRQI